jgi:Flp pilus assembly protein TadB
VLAASSVPTVILLVVAMVTVGMAGLIVFARYVTRRRKKKKFNSCYSVKAIKKKS